ncbi:MAG: phosphodiester glycosidase family protein [Lactovum sp.]
MKASATIKEKKQKDNKNIIYIILFFIFLIILSLFIAFKFSIEKKSTGVTKTNQTNGYSSVSKAEIISTEPVLNTGSPEWIQVVSQGEDEKFTNLSEGMFTIYKAHSPKILKTTYSIDSPILSMNDVITKYPNSLIMNASGFDMSSNTITGFQINNGQLFKDWGTDKRANNAFVIMKDGSSKIYDSSIPASTVMTDGAAMSFSFGSILIRDGVVQANDGSVNWMIHSFIGNDKDNNLYLIISDTSVGYNLIIQTLTSLSLENVVVLDGGGSSQMSINGETLYFSQDDRAVSDYIVLQ